MEDKLKEAILIALKNSKHLTVLELIKDLPSLHTYCLSQAIKNNNIDFINLYFKQKFIATLHYQILLSLAARIDYSEILTLLLKEPHFQTTLNIHSALMSALRSRSINSINVLFKFLNYPTNGTAFFISACGIGCKQSIQLLLSKDFTYSEYFNPFLLVLKNKDFFSNNHIDMLEIIINSKIFNANINNNQAIILAKSLNCQETIKLFWNETCVKNTLRQDYPELYSDLIKVDVQEKISQFQ